MYYTLIILSVVMFGGGFALNDVYRKNRGSNIKTSLEFTLVSSFAGLVVLLMLNGLKFEYTLFTLIMALLASLNGFAFTFCGFKALDHINLSLYSLFSMLGGMALPFVQGIAFYGEKITIAKLVGFVLLTVALLFTVKSGERKKGYIYYVGIFVLNGMSGVISKIYTSSAFPKASAAGYSVLMSICSIVLSFVFLTVFSAKFVKTSKFTLKSGIIGSLCGVLNKVANYILVLALLHVDASVQYPMVTGGVMIVSTAICFFGDKKPSKKELVSIAIAFIGMLALFVIPV